MPPLPRATDIRTVLNILYPNPPVPLNHSDTFTFLVAVVLSAQTTDGKVNDVTNVLFKQASTPQQLANMRTEDVQEIIQSVGLAPKKASYLVGLSKKLVVDFDGKVPSTYAELESLPGVGHKTASVIMSQVIFLTAPMHPNVLPVTTRAGFRRAGHCGGYACASLGPALGII